MKVVAKLAKLSPPPPTTQDRRNRGGRGAGGHVPPFQFLVDQLTLSQLGEAHYANTLLSAPRIFRLSYVPALLLLLQVDQE